MAPCVAVPTYSSAEWTVWLIFANKMFVPQKTSAIGVKHTIIFAVGGIPGTVTNEL